MNYVLNQKVATDGLQVARRRIMRWPGRPLDDLDVDAVSRRLAPPVVVHWAGVKRLRHRDMNGAGLLSHFEARYYSRIPRGRLLGPIRALRETVAGWFRHQRVRVRLAWRRITASTHQVTNHPEESR